MTMTKLEIISELNKLPKKEVVNFLSTILDLSAHWLNGHTEELESDAYMFGWYMSRMTLLDIACGGEYKDLFKKLVNDNARRKYFEIFE